MLPRTLVCTFVLVQAALAQAVWNVDCAGSPGSHFTTLQAAVDAASPGDEIRVYRTTGCDGPGAIITKPLRIVGFELGSITPPGYPGGIPSSVDIAGSLVVIGIPEGQRVTISNVSLSRTYSAIGWPQPFGLVGIDCDGELVLEDVHVLGSGDWESYVHF